MSDLTGLLAAWLKYSTTRRQVAHLHQITELGATASDPKCALEIAAAKQRELGWSLLKLAADVATYFPQATWVAWTRWSNQNGWHDGYIAICGIVAALCSCRSEWIKMGSKKSERVRERIG
jgi:hypothetical protein